MRFVYATGKARKLEFAVAPRREAIPEGAEVFAVCDGVLTVHQLNVRALNMTDEEHSMLQGLINDSQRAEAASAHLVTFPDASLLRRLVRRVLRL
jgi:hypothetical protein